MSGAIGAEALALVTRRGPSTSSLAYAARDGGASRPRSPPHPSGLAGRLTRCLGVSMITTC